MKTTTKKRTTISVPAELLREFKQWVEPGAGSNLSIYMQEQIRIKKREKASLEIKQKMKNQSKAKMNDLISFYKDDRK